MSNQQLIFLSHASQDKPAVRRLSQRLKADGFDPWLDEERILPGQDWNLEIEKAMRLSGAILLCFSALSVAKEGYIQREYKRAMQYQEEKPEGPSSSSRCALMIARYHSRCVKSSGWTIRMGMTGWCWHSTSTPGKSSQWVNLLSKKEKNKKPPTKRISGGTTFNIQGGIHVGGNLIQGDQTITRYTAGRDIIKGDQHNTTINYAPPQSPAELAAILYQLLAQIAAIKQEPGLTSIQRGIIQSAEQKIAEAAKEAAKPQPLGERIKTTLTEAKKYMEAIGGSLASAMALGTTIGTLLVGVAKLFGL